MPTRAPMTAAEAEAVIAEAMTQRVPPRKFAASLRRLAAMPFANLSPEARAVYAAFVADNLGETA